MKTGDESLFSGDNADIRVGFTVVPGFKIGLDAIYLSPAAGGVHGCWQQDWHVGPVFGRRKRM